MKFLKTYKAKSFFSNVPEMKIRHNVQDDFSKISKVSLFGHYKAKTKLRKKRPILKY